MRSILLVEPDYTTRFPPLGLLKIGTYHRKQGDTVTLVRGMVKDYEYYDRVYITTLFSFQHSRTIETIRFYKDRVGGDLKRIFVGGIYASLYPQAIYNETGVFPHVGLLDKPGILGNDDIVVDLLVPDYGLLENLTYDYGLKDCYVGYATRGCPNRCPFCAVHRIEPTFNDYTGLFQYVQAVRQDYGERRNLVLMDNNVLASRSFAKIIRDIVKLGFERGAKFEGRKRFVDFNQGLDASLVDDGKAKLLASICIDPLRLAYDYASERRSFEQAIGRLARYEIDGISTYMLYNFQDSPDDLYTRLRHVIDLNQKHGLKVYSFPMRYTPLGQRDRAHVGPRWTKREIRGIQCILNVAKGLVSHRADLFMRAFGGSPDEMQEIIWMPDRYILQRNDHENGLAKTWRRTFKGLSPALRAQLKSIVGPNDMARVKQEYVGVKSKQVRSLLDAHLDE